MHLGIDSWSWGLDFMAWLWIEGDGCLGIDGHKPVFYVVIMITVIKIKRVKITAFKNSY